MRKIRWGQLGIGALTMSWGYPDASATLTVVGRIVRGGARPSVIPMWSPSYISAHDTAQPSAPPDMTRSGPDL